MEQPRTAHAAIPEALYVFLALIFAGTDAIDEEEDDQEDDTPRAAKLRTMILDTCQDGKHL